MRKKKVKRKTALSKTALDPAGKTRGGGLLYVPFQVKKEWGCGVTLWLGLYQL